jgi:hypothetical protein
MLIFEISWPAFDLRTILYPFSILLTMTYESETYVNSNLPLYLDFFKHTSKASTDPQSEPIPILDPSDFHAQAVTE